VHLYVDEIDMNTRLELALSPESLEPLVHHIAALVVEQLRRDASPWMTRAEVAEYLHMPVSRLEKRRDVPCYRDGRRIIYRRDEVDRWLVEKRLHPVRGADELRSDPGTPVPR